MSGPTGLQSSILSKQEQNPERLERDKATEPRTQKRHRTPPLSPADPSDKGTEHTNDSETTQESMSLVLFYLSITLEPAGQMHVQSRKVAWLLSSSLRDPDRCARQMKTGSVKQRDASQSQAWSESPSPWPLQAGQA